MFVLILTALLFVVLNNSRAEARPIISTKSDTGKIFTGESITLTCNMDSLSTHLWYNYNWYRDETKISKGRIYTINRATSEDSGDYTCTYKVITSYRSDPFTLKVSDDVFSDPELNMDPIQLTVGAPMTLTCATRLAPYKLGTELQVAFFRNGEKVQEFGKSNQYRVKSSKLYHSGDYTCEVRTATDSVRKISQKLNIKIEGTMARPVISLTPNWGKIFTGESVTLTCNVGFSEQDKQKYYWYKDKQKISKSEKTFKIQSAITDDSGFYQCQTRSSGFSDPITLDVRNNDFILQAPNSVYEGDYLKLECNKKTKYSDFSPRFYHRDKLLQSDSGSNFHLDNAETSDSGTYRCTYNYYYGDYYEDSANVTVQELFSIPHISVSPNPLTLGADTTLTCDTSLALLRADTELEFAFYRNGKMVQGFRTSNTYRIKILDWDLLGNYTCDAITSTRSVKKTSRRSNIKIAGAGASPFITVVPNTGKIFKGESITATCNPTKETYQSHRWYKNSQNMYEYKSYIIISAEKKNSGFYQCEIGYSDKSEPFTLIVSDETLVRPVISVTPNTRKIFIGDSITLTCNVESVSQGDQNYYWYKDSKYVYITGKTFTIQSAEIDDSGDYQCETERGDQSDAFNLDVGNDLSTRVTVILGPPGGLITKGERLKVTCSVDRGSGNLEFKWCKQDSENCNKMYQAGSHQEHFLVESVVESYSGDYFCSVTANNIQVVFKSETVKISVHVPVFDARLHPYTDKLQMVVGDNMTFTCSVERGTTPHFQWWHNGVEVDNQSGMFQIRESGKMLYIESVNSDHEGKFYCKASNQISNKITTIQSNVLNVLVIVPVSGARIRADRDILELGIGDNVTFTCSVEQGTFPFFLWRHNGKDVDHKSELYLIKEYGRILYIEPVLSLHRGTYQCWTSNQGSNRNFTAESNVLTISVAENTLTYLAPAISSFLLIVILTTAILVFIYRHKLPLPCTKSHQPEPRTEFAKVQVRTALGPRNEMNQLGSEDEQTEYRNLPARSPARDSYIEDDIYYIDIRCVPQESSAPPVDNYSVTYSAVKCSNIIEEACKDPQEELSGSSPNIYENFSSN